MPTAEAPLSSTGRHHPLPHTAGGRLDEELIRLQFCFQFCFQFGFLFGFHRHRAFVYQEYRSNVLILACYYSPNVALCRTAAFVVGDPCRLAVRKLYLHFASVAN